MIATMENDLYLASYKQFESSASAQWPVWLRERRALAIGRYQALGLPESKDEAWRGMRLGPLTQGAFEQAAVGHPHTGFAAVESMDPLVFGQADVHRLVFVNGGFSSELSAVSDLPAGVKLTSLAAALGHDGDVLEPHLARLAGYEDQVFWALNTALFRDGAFLSIPDGVVLERPVLILYVSTSHGASRQSVSYPRTLILAGADSRATILEGYVGAQGQTYLTNALTEARVGPGARIEHYKLQQESRDALHLGGVYASVDRGACFVTQSMDLGGKLVRNEVYVELVGQAAEATLNGLYLARGEQHIDNYTTLIHAAPDCPSRELYKGVLDGCSRGVFRGRIIVRPGAQKTDSKQTNQNLLLSDEAEADAKPQLEIYADDVKCTHGATIGALDDEALFYLRARGVDPVAARALLTYGFAEDIVGRIQVPVLRERLEEELFKWLRRDGQGLPSQA